LVYSYLKIEKNIENEDIEKATIKFKIEKAWLTANGFTKDEIVLKRYDNAWESLTTVLDKTDNQYVYYEAETPSFSYFAIIAEKKPEPIITPEPEEEASEPEETPIFEKEPTKEPVKSRKAIYTILSIAAVILTIILINLWNKKPKQPQKQFQLPSFEKLIKPIKGKG